MSLGRGAAFVGEDQSLLAVSSSSHGTIFIFSALTQSPLPVRTLTLHAAPVTAMVFNYKHKCVISADEGGILEYWAASVFDNNNSNNNNKNNPVSQPSPYASIGAAPSKAANGITFESKLLHTDLHVLVRKKTCAASLCLDPTGSHFCVYGADRKVRIFNYSTGKLLVQYDERIKVYDALVQKRLERNQQTEDTNNNNNSMDAIDYGKRAATERELSETSILNPAATRTHSLLHECGHQHLVPQFDPVAGTHLLLPTVLGVKLIHWSTNRCIKLLGKQDASALRFLGGCLCPGDAAVDRQMMLARSNTNTPTTQTQPATHSDALFVTMAYKKRRMYIFSHLDPVAAAEEHDHHATDHSAQDAVLARDVLNEPPDADDLILSVNAAGQGTGQDANITGESHLGKEAVLRTSMGDIHLKLFNDDTPRTIENFCGHARAGYYDNVIFHRVIKGFMIQTGDPLGDGTGGESIWGGEFEDEFVRE